MLWQRSSLGMTGAVSADEYEDIMFVIVLTNGITKIYCVRRIIKRLIIFNAHNVH